MNCEIIVLCLYSSASTDKPTLSQRIADTVKSYIYTPEKGESFQTTMSLVFIVAIM